MFFTKQIFNYSSSSIEELNTSKGGYKPAMRLKRGLVSVLAILAIIVGTAFTADAQCNIEFTGAPCVNGDLDFEVTGLPSGAKNYLWDFAGKKSNNQRPTIAFNSGGNKVIKIDVKDANGNVLCTATRTIYVNKSPVAKIKVVSDSVQCFRGNMFCVENLSTAGEPGAKIIESSMLFGDGGFCAKYQALGDDPLEKCCHSVVDDNGGTFDITLRVVDDNGCVTEKTFKNKITVRGNLGLDFFTDAPVECGVTTATFTNNSRIAFSEVKTWTWDFGDGTKSVDTDWAGLKHDYTGNGVFDATLVVTSVYDCTDTFEFKSAAENIRLDLNIEANKDSTCISDPEIFFSQKPVVSNRQVNFLWNFGDPASGPLNSDNENWSTSHSYVSLAAHQVSLIVQVGSVCLDTVYYDSAWIIGPIAKIEDPSLPSVIADSERYQCKINNTVHFPNNSIFYHNGDTLIMNPLAYFQDYNVDRLWTFGDQYAKQCTTDTKANINVGVNCNFSKDRRPEHTYTDWDTIYRDSFYLPNRTLRYSVFDKATRTCSLVSVDTSDAELHKSLFFEQVPQCMTVTLALEDTVHPFNCKSTSAVSLALTKPDARRLKWRGRLCTGNDNPGNGVRFDMSGTKPGCTQFQTWVNFDTLQNPKVWVGPNAGLFAGTLPSPDPNPWAAPPPSSRPNFFIKKYGINDVFDKKTGWVSVGLIIGNGTDVPLPSECKDTFIYDSLFRIIPINATYNVLNDTFSPMVADELHFCKGEEVTVSMNYPYQDSISTLTWDWNDGYRTQELRVRYKQNPNNPNELYNYLLEREIDPNSNITITDSIVTRIITSWDTVADVSLAEDILDGIFESLGFFMREIDPADIPLFFNDGTGPGCIDTTGFGNLIRYGIRPKTSIVTNFRDTMVGAFDTVHIQEMYVDDGLGGFDTVPAHVQPVARHTYNTAGQYIQSLTLRNTLGCQDRRGYIVLIGFHGQISAENTPVCKGTKIKFNQFVRYFSFDPITDGLYDPVKYWDNPARALAGLETMKWDFDKNDDDPGNPSTIFGEFGPGQEHAYSDSGEYIVRVALKDSTGCLDTVETKVYVTDIEAYFGFNDLTPAGGCINIIQFFDSSLLHDPCVRAFGQSCDQIDSFWWDFGDPLSKDNKSRLRNPGHNYERFGTYEVKLIIQSKLGCRDTIVRPITFEGPDPKFDHTTLQICQGEQVALFNKSNDPDVSAKWVWNWGDNSFNSSEYSDYPNDTQRHVYTVPGHYCITQSETQTFFLPSGAPYQCKVTYPYGDSICVTVINTKLSDFEASDDTVCPNDIITFTDKSDSIYTEWDWEFGDGTTGSGNVITHSYSKPGDYTVVLCPQYTDTGAFTPECPTCDSMLIHVESIKADFEIDTVNKPFFRFTNTSSSAVQYRWTFLNAEQTPDSEKFPLPKIEFFDETPCESPGQNIGPLPCTGRGLNFINFQGEFFVCLEATNINGCADTICKLVRQDFFSLIRPHNVFTPDNNDGLNDVFEIDILGEEMYDLTIYNRWGVKVFESTDSQYDWNGKVMNNGEPCPEGTYFWTLNYRLGGREDATLSGTVTLIRK